MSNDTSNEQTPKPLIPPLSAKVRFAHTFGQFAEGIKNDSFTIFLLFYYTNVLGLSGSLAGLAILIALIFDAVTDPLMGVVSDRTRSSWGRRHPYMLASALPLGLSFYAIFAVPSGLEQTGLFWWMLVSIVICRASMSLFHVPHLSLGAELSSDYHERTRIVTERQLFARLAILVPIVVGLMWLMSATEAYPDGRFNPEAYPTYGLIAAIIMVVIIVFTTLGTRSRIPYLNVPKVAEKTPNPFQSILVENKLAFQIKSFQGLFLGFLFAILSLGVNMTLMLHLSTFYWEIGIDKMMMWSGIHMLGLLLGLVIWGRFVRSLGKRIVFLYGLAIFCIFLSTPYLLNSAGFWPSNESVLYIPMLFITTGFIAGFGFAACAITSQSMMADVCDEDELRTGRRREGVFFGAIAFATKASFGLGALIAGLITDISGIDQLQAGERASDQMLLQLGMSQGLIILILLTLAGWCFQRYDISQSKLEDIQKQLAAKI